VYVPVAVAYFFFGVEFLDGDGKPIMLLVLCYFACMSFIPMFSLMPLTALALTVSFAIMGIKDIRGVRIQNRAAERSAIELID
jgi:hypothetical protein